MVAIIGGGLGGLSTAYYLLKTNIAVKNNLKLFLFEATNYGGGWIKSIKTKDYIFEQGPRTISSRGITGINTLNMIEDLGLSEHIAPISAEHPAAKNRMIYVNQNLHLLPSSLKEVFQKNLPFSKPLIYALFHDLSKPHKQTQDDSIYNFVERRFGKEIADYAIAPIICGICAGDAKEISVKFLMKTLFEWEQNYGGVVKGMMRTMFSPKTGQHVKLSSLAKRAQEERWNTYTIKGGLETFPTTLLNYLTQNKVDINLNTNISELQFVDSSNVLLKNASGELFTASHVYSTIPSYALAKLVNKQHPDLAQELEDIPFVTVGIVNLYFATDKELVIPAFGFFVPPIESSLILGVVFDSYFIPNQNGTVLTVMLGGKWFKEKFGDSVTKEELYGIAMQEIESILNIKQKPSVYNVNILHNCIPQYVIGHYERVKNIREYIVKNNLPISLVGSSYDGVSINDVIYSAKTQVEEDCTIEKRYE